MIEALFFAKIYQAKKPAMKSCMFFDSMRDYSKSGGKNSIVVRGPRGCFHEGRLPVIITQLTRSSLRSSDIE